MRIKKVLQVNNNLEVELRNFKVGKERMKGKSLIQEVYDNSFSIMVPVNERYSLYLYQGDEVLVSIFTNTTGYIFHSEVLVHKSEKGIPLVILKKPQEVEAHERRQLVRVETWLLVNYEIILPEEKSNWKCIEPSKEGYTVDLSGGGLQLILSWPLSKEYLIILNIPPDIKGDILGGVRPH